MGGKDGVHHPIVTWAQRKEHIFLTLEVEVKNMKLDVEPKKLIFSGEGDKQTKYGCEIEFFAEVETGDENVKRAQTARHIQLLIPKKDKDAEWWPRLTSAKTKHPCIKVDFDKWKDEDEVEEGDDALGGMMGGNNFDLNSMMSQMGGMGGMDDRPDLGDLGDSDNEELPDLEDDEGDEKPSTAANGDAPTPTTA